MDFTPDERAIFAYHDGEKVVKADPLELHWRILALTSGDPRKFVAPVLAADASTDPVEKCHGALQMVERFVPLVRQAFDLKPFDPATGQGATARLALKVWNEFQLFLKKKRAVPSLRRPRRRLRRPLRQPPRLRLRRRPLAEPAPPAPARRFGDGARRLGTTQ